ncbi:MAG: hypothetical protein ABI852_02875 [Gemmatimonadaceae bacterium]
MTFASKDGGNDAADRISSPPADTRRFSSPHTATPATQLLSNGSYSLMITAAGSGYSRWRDIAVSRWRDDATLDNTGSSIFLHDLTNDFVWSAGYQPSRVEAQSYEVSFDDQHASFVRRDGVIETRLDVMVAHNDDGELRRVSITNHDTIAHDIDITSYSEIVLATAASDAAHPAFSNLFVETECDVAHETLLATRRLSKPDDTPVWLVHSVAMQGESIGALQWETSRELFLGRGRNVHDAKAQMNRNEPLSNTVGSVLDPIVSLRRRVRVPPGETVNCTFVTFVAASREAAVELADRYRAVTAFDAVALAWRESHLTRSYVRDAVSDESQLFQSIAGHVLYPNASLRVRHALMLHDDATAVLWSNGISGDLPIVVVTLDDGPSGEHALLELVGQLLRAHTYWRSKCLAVDVIIINDVQSASGGMLQSQVEALIHDADGGLTPETVRANGATFAFRGQQLTAAQRSVLESAARVIFLSRRGTMADQLTAITLPDVAAPPRPVRVTQAENVSAAKSGSHRQLEFFNGFGGFDRDGREYVTVLRAGEWTPAPWTNVIANADFGCLVTECGSGSTWSINSQLNVLTPWSNDPVSDPPSDAFYIRDDDSGEVWTPTPLPIREHSGEYVVRHGPGYTQFERESHDIGHELLQFVPVDDPIKISRLTLTNRSEHARRLSITGYLDWVLGTTRSSSAPHVTTEMDSETGAMFARNCWNRDFSSRVAFADLAGMQQSWTGDRTEFLSRNGTATLPLAVASGVTLSGHVGAALDPCCALQAVIEIPAGGQAVIVLLIGETATTDDARALITRYRKESLDGHLAAVTDAWTSVFGAVQVQTPDRALDIMLNQWLLYQTLACRVWGRTAFYQASGAYGFRDQLQDVMALAVSRPNITREHILRAASRQFVAGDVQHWWHEPSGAGVRTRISDDRLWLPFAVTHYVSVTGDYAVLDEVVPFLDGAALKSEQNESYFAPAEATEHGTLFEHCARALEQSLAIGAHGLPLMGTGDWNDGMNRVGVEGKGESVWLAWFLYTNLQAWVSIATERGQNARAATWTAHAGALQAAVEREAWDGAWYTRAFFDDGTPLGVAGADACAIDAIAQSWSVMSGGGETAHARQAMRRVDEHLVRPKDRLSLLFTPPFDHSALEPGYIKGYVPGVRENGGQYTHAAVWTAIAFAELGDGDKAGALLDMLNPITRSDTQNAAQQYRVEPYVMVGDVYSEPPHVARGGWSWYTGSAGWMYRAGMEWLLGVRVRGTRVLIDPCIPSTWPKFALQLRAGTAQYEITVENPHSVCRGLALLELDGVALDDRSGFPIVDDAQTHRVRAVLGHMQQLAGTNNI